MPRLIDADALGTIQSIQSADFNSIETIREWICRQPTIDAVPVVRCRECINYHRNKHDRGDDSYCSIFCTEIYPDSYCSMGQRMPRRKDLER